MKEYQRKDFSKLLKKGALEGRRYLNSSGSTAVRIYDRNIDDIPVTVELYGPYAKIVDYSADGLSPEDEETVIDLVNRMVYVERSKIIYQQRRKREGTEQHVKQSGDALELTVREGGLSFLVDLVSHIDTGLFLDQALTRDMVRTLSFGLRVLNLFSYTGSFSVYAAAGGAESVTSVDLSNTYCAVARRNLQANGFLDEDKYRVIREDCLSFIESEISAKSSYDLIIFDPPSFSNSHNMKKKFDVKKDYLEWIYMLSKIMSEHALLIFSCNLGNFALDKQTLKQAFKIRVLTDEVRAPGFTRSGSGTVQVWMLEKTAPMKEIRKKVRKYAEGGFRKDMKKINDNDFDALINSLAGESGDEEKDRQERRSYTGKPSYGRGREEGREGSRYPFSRREDRSSDRYREYGKDRYSSRGERSYYRNGRSERPYRDDGPGRYGRRDDRDGFRGRDGRADDDYPRRRSYEGEERKPYREKKQDSYRSRPKAYGYDNIKRSRSRRDEDDE